ncbi:MAG: plasmid pRiA4b ORF-3 family protein [Sphingobacteriales bacterium]|nr:plasmid pRiA4b ORF-3 family protein [Sphingobacteriales bacterium]
MTLQWTKPPIWRRVLVDKSTTFEQLHYIIQTAMGWSNSHLHEFDVNGYRIAVPYEEFDDGFDDESIDASTVSIDKFVTEAKSAFRYTYDFGDGWEHKIVVKNFYHKTQNKIPYLYRRKIKLPTRRLRRSSWLLRVA